MINLEHIAQGDVLIKPIKKLPNGLKKLDTKTLQEGETTGHRHRFLDDANVEVYLEDMPIEPGRIMPFQRKFIVVGNTVKLFHEEHKPVTVEPGVYEVDLVREFDYDSKEMARVVD